MAVYMIADIRIINQQRYEEYRALVRDAIRQHGGRYIARASAVRVLEGNWAPPRIVIIEFPGMGEAHAFYKSPVYAKAREVCANAAMLDMVLVEGVADAPVARQHTGTPAYLITDTKVINPERFEEYRKFAAGGVSRAGGKYLVRDGQVEVLEGGWQPTRLAMVEFADIESVESRLDSDEFHAARDLRINAAMVDMIVVEGLPHGAEL